MPEWLPGVLQELAKQLPALGLAVAFGIIIFRHMTRQQTEHLNSLMQQHKDHLASLTARQDAELRRLVETYDKAMAAKEEEITRLCADRDAIQKDRDSLYKLIKAEQKKA